MSIWLGIRISASGGRPSLVRFLLIAAGVAVGVVLLLSSLAAMPALQGRIDRYAWHRTSAESPATAPDKALWLPVTDRFDGRKIVRIQVAALGPQPPVPPGMDRLPGPGEVVVSPALADLFRAVPDDQLRNRFPGRVTGTIGPAGLVSPAELVAVIGRAPEELRDREGVEEIAGIEQPRDAIDLRGILQVAVLVLAVLLLGPVLVFVSMVTRVGATQRELRFAAIRLAGATRWQTGVMAATETAGAAILGTLLGWAAFAVLRVTAGARITFEEMPFPLADLRPPAGLAVLALVGMPVIAAATTLVALHRVQITPLGARRRARRRRPGAWRLLPIAAGIAGVIYIGNHGQDTADENNPTMALLSLASPLAILIGLVLAGPWACMWISRGLARLSGRAATLLAARRIAADPYTAFRAVSGVALAVFVATILGTVAVGEREQAYQSPLALDPGVVAVRVRGATDPAALAPLLTERAVVVRSVPGGVQVVHCADLARVTTLTCPVAPSVFTEALRELWYPQAIIEPAPEQGDLAIHTILVPTDGSRAAVERVRTIAALAAPYSLARTAEDHRAADADNASAGLDNAMRLATLFVLLVAACSLTVSVAAGLMERRRPFALLRAAGANLGELRWTALLETGVPLVLTVLGGVGIAILTTYVAVPSENWVLPTAGFFVTLAAGVLAAAAVTLITWPLMNSATGHESVRFE